MINKLIRNNISYLNPYLVRGLLYAKGIYITEDESKYLNYAIKENYIDLLNKDYKSSLNYLYNKINKKDLDEILNLYIEVSGKYL